MFDTQLYFRGFAIFNLFKLLKISSPDALVAKISAPRSIKTEISRYLQLHISHSRVYQSEGLFRDSNDLVRKI